MQHDEIETLAEYVADSLWLCAVADAVERAADDGDPGARDFRPGAGGDWKDTDYRPVPGSFLAVARRVLSGLPAGILSAGGTAWRDLSGCDSERFGHVVAMEILGHGVGLSDDIPPDNGQDPERFGAVRRLSDALPCLDSSAELFATWNPETGKVQP